MKKIFTIVAACIVVLGALVYLVFQLDAYGFISLKRMFKRQYDLSFYLSDKGTAQKLDGKTVAVSIFVSEYDNVWTDADKEKKEQQLGYLKMATEWIENQAAARNIEAEFVYDWSSDSELYYEAVFDETVTNYSIRENDGYNLMWDHLNNEVRSQYLMDKYDADNIIYLLYFNTKTDFYRFVPCAKDCYLDPQYSYDTCYFPIGYVGLTLSPPVVAHEILHLFGAIDLYKGGELIDFYGNNDRFIEYVAENLPKDLMYSEADPVTGELYFDSIPREITDITAYYIGWLEERPEVIDEYGLDYSQHDPDREAQIAKKYADIL